MLFARKLIMKAIICISILEGIIINGIISASINDTTNLITINNNNNNNNNNDNDNEVENNHAYSMGRDFEVMPARPRQNLIKSLQQPTILKGVIIFGPDIMAYELLLLPKQPIQQFKATKFERNEHEGKVKAKMAAFRKREKRSVFHVRWHPTEKYIVESLEKPAINSSKYSPHPRLKVSKTTKLTFNPKLYSCRDKYDNRCFNRTWAYRERILHILEKSLDEMAINETNFYNVDFKPIFGDSFEEQYYPSSCLIMEAGVNVLKRNDLSLNKLPLSKLLPRQKLFRHNKTIKTCAIVSSAGSMAGSKLGRFIDTHDIVMRFNDAPTKGYETDVGTKTTIRVVNSQVVTKAEYNFTRAEIFRNVTIAAWDSGKYNSTIEDWLTTSDYNLFTNYAIYRQRNPKSRAFLVDPHSIWRLWQSLQTFAGNRPIRKNPPSSGFIGLALILPYCPVVHFIEYIPSTRLNGRCHYYNKEINSACTFGTWHPLAAEKLMALDMNVADDVSVFQYGILRIQRPNKLLCGFNFFGY